VSSKNQQVRWLATIMGQAGVWKEDFAIAFQV
jgi:hypothetical protein